MKAFKKFSAFVSALTLSYLPTLVFAHENYVLPTADIDRGMSDWSINVLDALKNPDNILISLYVSIGALVVFGLYYLFFTSRPGIVFDRRIKKLEPLGHVMLRLALAFSFIASAYFNSFLGPEIPLTSLPLGLLLKPVLYIIGALLLVGLFSKIVGAIGLAILILATIVYKDYMITYVNYYGEFIALILYGSMVFSLDSLLLRASRFAKKFQEWEIPLIRITYGISILYPAITIKLLHPAIILQIVNQYKLNEISWLFPSDPLLISLGTGVTQVALGLLIIIGFETRLNALATFVLYLLSIIFFKEAVWPHYILLALALYLAINNGGEYSIDNLLQKQALKKRGLRKKALTPLS